MKNLILDFMDPENRILYGTYKNYSAEKHVSTLKKALNLAILICKDYCILPPCAILQCRYVRKALFESQEYLDEELIRFPLRESSLSAFFDKKRKNYNLDKDDEDYSDFFSSDGPDYLREHLTGLIKRETKMGEAIAMSVAALSFDDPLWTELKRTYDIDFLEKIRQAPTALISSGAAISVKGIKRLLHIDDDIDFQLGRILQNKYFLIYISEYDAEIIHDIPPKTTDFFIRHTSVFYEYQFLRHVFNTIGLFNWIHEASPAYIVRVRQLASYFSFLSTIEEIATLSNDVREAKHKVSQIAEAIAPFDQIATEQKNPNAIIRDVAYRFEQFVKAYEAHRKTDAPKQGSTPITTSDTQRIEALKLQLKPCDMSKPFVFVGYNRGDSEERVYRDCITLGRMGVNYWVDNANMQGCLPDSDGWKSIIRNAISSCSVYIPYISPSFFNSKPCCNEVKMFFELNHTASIVLLIQNDLPVEHIIQRILTYDNILQGDIARSMVMLFKATSSDKEQYALDQPYRYCSKSFFEYYFTDSIFFNTFTERKVLKYPIISFEQWRNLGQSEIDKMKKGNDDHDAQ